MRIYRFIFMYKKLFRLPAMDQYRIDLVDQLAVDVERFSQLFYGIFFIFYANAN